ncbi:copine-8-like isoform X3 [Zootermopsis nevadensis]|uniref:copine-8-like isoform X3 n=1 Tax=Zootermopsis nevadensis TaxID=136037 RepID=UPI000B8E5640|nr:copine-8-like isoform X3 [Zootermopsis nevadensis]
MSSNFVPGTAAEPTSEVELTLSCRGLVGKDVLSKSDPICVTYVQRFGDPRWVEFHRTEVISNTHDPDFVAKVRLFYRFEEQQPLKFEIYDSDSSSSSLDRHDFLGAATCSLGQIISNGKVQLPLSLTGTGTTEGRGHMIIIAEELAALKDEVIMQFSGTKLDKKDFFGKSDPFLVFHKSTESGDYIVVYKTEVVKHTLNPVWPKFSVPVRSLCNGDYDRNIKVVCYDHESDGDHNLIGEFYVTLRQLTQGPSPSNVFQCINPEKKKKKSSYIHSGLITLNSIEVRQIYSFMDYMKGGTQLHCSIAIDFTGSNGNPAMPESLHYISNIPNAYEQAIQSVGRIIQDYDTDKLFPVLGFGARIPPDGQVSHEFFVNMNPSNPYCNGVSGVLEAYRRCILQVQLYGPTNFSPVINHVARFASTYRDGSSYFILLILTDGVITDMPQTIAKKYWNF